MTAVPGANDRVCVKCQIWVTVCGASPSRVMYRPRPSAGGSAPALAVAGGAIDPVYMSGKFESFERINLIRVTNGNFDSCNLCKRLVPSRLHELHESKFPFVTRIEFIRSKLRIGLLMYPGH